MVSKPGWWDAQPTDDKGELQTIAKQFPRSRVKPKPGFEYRRPTIMGRSGVQTWSFERSFFW